MGMKDDLYLDDLLAILSEECGSAGNATAWARGRGLSGSYVRDVLNGQRRPGPAMLAPLGLERIIVYRKISKEAR
jgi:hypothetical protein